MAIDTTAPAYKHAANFLEAHVGDTNTNLAEFFAAATEYYGISTITAQDGDNNNNNNNKRPKTEIELATDIAAKLLNPPNNVPKKDLETIYKAFIHAKAFQALTSSANASISAPEKKNRIRFKNLVSSHCDFQNAGLFQDGRSATGEFKLEIALEMQRSTASIENNQRGHLEMLYQLHYQQIDTAVINAQKRFDEVNSDIEKYKADAEEKRKAAENAASASSSDDNNNNNNNITVVSSSISAPSSAAVVIDDISDENKEKLKIATEALSKAKAQQAVELSIDTVTTLLEIHQKANTFFSRYATPELEIHRDAMICGMAIQYNVVSIGRQSIYELAVKFTYEMKITKAHQSKNAFEYFFIKLLDDDTTHNNLRQEINDFAKEHSAYNISWVRSTFNAAVSPTYQIPFNNRNIVNIGQGVFYAGNKTLVTAIDAAKRARNAADAANVAAEEGKVEEVEKQIKLAQTAVAEADAAAAKIVGGLAGLPVPQSVKPKLAAAKPVAATNLQSLRELKRQSTYVDFKSNRNLLPVMVQAPDTKLLGVFTPDSDKNTNSNNNPHTRKTPAVPPKTEPSYEGEEKNQRKWATDTRNQAFDARQALNEAEQALIRAQAFRRRTQQARDLTKQYRNDIWVNALVFTLAKAYKIKTLIPADDANSEPSPKPLEAIIFEISEALDASSSDNVHPLTDCFNTLMENANAALSPKEKIETALKDDANATSNYMMNMLVLESLAAAQSVLKSKSLASNEINMVWLFIEQVQNILNGQGMRNSNATLVTFNTLCTLLKLEEKPKVAGTNVPKTVFEQFVENVLNRKNALKEAINVKRLPVKVDNDLPEIKEAIDRIINAFDASPLNSTSENSAQNAVLQQFTDSYLLSDAYLAWLENNIPHHINMLLENQQLFKDIITHKHYLSNTLLAHLGEMHNQFVNNTWAPKTVQEKFATAEPGTKEAKVQQQITVLSSNLKQIVDNASQYSASETELPFEHAKTLYTSITVKRQSDLLQNARKNTSTTHTDEKLLLRTVFPDDSNNTELNVESARTFLDRWVIPELKNYIKQHSPQLGRALEVVERLQFPKHTLETLINKTYVSQKEDYPVEHDITLTFDAAFIQFYHLIQALDLDDPWAEDVIGGIIQFLNALPENKQAFNDLYDVLTGHESPFYNQPHAQIVTQILSAHLADDATTKIDSAIAAYIQKFEAHLAAYLQLMTGTVAEIAAATNEIQAAQQELIVYLENFKRLNMVLDKAGYSTELLTNALTLATLGATQIASDIKNIGNAINIVRAALDTYFTSESVVNALPAINNAAVALATARGLIQRSQLPNSSLQQTTDIITSLEETLRLIKEGNAQEFATLKTTSKAIAGSDNAKERKAKVVRNYVAQIVAPAPTASPVAAASTTTTSAAPSNSNNRGQKRSVVVDETLNNNNTVATTHVAKPQASKALATKPSLSLSNDTNIAKYLQDNLDSIAALLDVSNEKKSNTNISSVLLAYHAKPNKPSAFQKGLVRFIVDLQVSGKDNAQQAYQHHTEALEALIKYDQDQLEAISKQDLPLKIVEKASDKFKARQTMVSNLCDNAKKQFGMMPKESKAWNWSIREFFAKLFENSATKAKKLAQENAELKQRAKQPEVFLWKECSIFGLNNLYDEIGLNLYVEAGVNQAEAPQYSDDNTLLGKAKRPKGKLYYFLTAMTGEPRDVNDDLSYEISALKDKLMRMREISIELETWKEFEAPDSNGRKSLEDLQAYNKQLNSSNKGQCEILGDEINDLERILLIRRIEDMLNQAETPNLFFNDKPANVRSFFNKDEKVDPLFRLCDKLTAKIPATIDADNIEVVLGSLATLQRVVQVMRQIKKYSKVETAVENLDTVLFDTFASLINQFAAGGQLDQSMIDAIKDQHYDYIDEYYTKTSSPNRVATPDDIDGVPDAISRFERAIAALNLMPRHAASERKKQDIESYIMHIKSTAFGNLKQYADEAKSKRQPAQMTVAEKLKYFVQLEETIVALRKIPNYAESATHADQVEDYLLNQVERSTYVNIGQYLVDDYLPNRSVDDYLPNQGVQPNSPVTATRLAASTRFEEKMHRRQNQYFAYINFYYQSLVPSIPAEITADNYVAAGQLVMTLLKISTALAKLVGHAQSQALAIEIRALPLVEQYTQLEQQQQQQQQREKAFNALPQKTYTKEVDYLDLSGVPSNAQAKLISPMFDKTLPLPTVPSFKPASTVTADASSASASSSSSSASSSSASAEAAVVTRGRSHSMPRLVGGTTKQ